MCDDESPLTEVAADGSLTDVPYVVADEPDVDCFYLYPTSSGDLGLNSDLETDNEVTVTRAQAGPFNQACRLYVPEYRSVTLAGLLSGRIDEGMGVAYGDVRDAWLHFLEHSGAGRPVVLVAHSQGAFHATRLLREEIDPDPAQRGRLVSAMLAGASFQVAPDRDVGGDTQDVPLCRAPDQYGCVVTWQTYRDEEPPTAGALFGAPVGDTASACTNPAALAGGPAEPASGFATVDWALPDSDGSISGVRVGVPGLVTTECRERDGYHYLAVTVHGDPADPRADDIPGDGIPNWGLHGVDVDIVQESLVDLVRSQSQAALASG